MKAVVMAGGEGTRLRPLTINCPKPLVPLCNKPIMEHILTLLKRHGINEVIATVHYLADEIQSYFGDGSDLDMNIVYSVESSPLGTAGSVKQAQEYLDNERFLILSGDSLTDCDLAKAIAFHEEKKSLVTLILYHVPSPLEFGVVITDEDGRVQRFLEKPSWSEVFSDTVNTGMYIIEPEVLNMIDPDKFYDWSQDIFPQLLEEGKPIYGYVMDEYWTDVGSLAQYREAHEHLLSGRINLPLSGEQRPGVYLGANCNISDAATIVPPVCIGRNCKIKHNARIGPYTTIGDNVFIENGATIERSVVWDSAYIGPHVSLRSAIAGYRATIKKDSVCNEDSVVGDRCLVDVGCTIRPRIKLWPDKVIERGSTVTMSLIWGNRWRGNLFRELGVAGLSNIEITPDFACRLGSAFGSTLPSRSAVVTSRDSTRSSRMIKRALISSLLSVGCNVIDLQSIALPIARHFIRNSEAAGALNVRKTPGNARVTLIEMFDSRGAYLGKNAERKIESAFSREDFLRIDPDDLGVIELGGHAIEDYQTDFARHLHAVLTKRHFRVVCDYGYSPVGSFYPSMLARLQVESISLNSYNDAKSAPRSEDEIARHVQNLRHIVASLNYDMGVLYTDEGERMIVIDDRGRELSGNTLFASLCWLIAKTHENPAIAMSITAPSRIEEELIKQGVQVIRTKVDTRSIMSTSSDVGATFAGDDRGGFIFPDFHPGFDAPYTFAKMITMLQMLNLPLSEVVTELPQFQMAYEQVRCPWESKGVVMRRISEERQGNSRIELLDGIKIFNEDGWVLVLPDAVEPLFHVYAESDKVKDSQSLVADYVNKIEGFQSSVPQQGSNPG
jgi:mannose-1-phosphate guanylyltransferase/phosphomannomutase